MKGVDCEGTPVAAPVDVCVEPPSGWRLDVVKPRFVDPVLKAATADMIASWMDRHTFQLHPGGPVPAPKPVRVDDGFGNIDPEKVREALPGVPVVSHPTVKGAVLIGDDAARDLLTRTLEAEADALSFPPAGSVWRSPSTGRDGTVEYAPNGRRWRLLFDDGPGEWCYDGIAEGWEVVTHLDAEGAALEAMARGGVAPAAPQAVTLEIATINAADPGGYRFPADAYLPAPEVPRE